MSARNRPPKQLFPGWRVSPGGERRLFARAEDVPAGWFRAGDPIGEGAGVVSPGEVAPRLPPAAPAYPPEPAVPDDPAAAKREKERQRAAANRAKRKAGA